MSLMSGKSFVNSIQFHTNSLYTLGHASCGIGSRPSSCDACGCYEPLSHILHVCKPTKYARDSCHNHIASYICHVLQKKGYDVLVEPSIPTLAGIRKPDIIAAKGGQAMVIDVTIVADNASLNHAHDI